ncbi:MFS transporter [Paraburkholderia tropica]|uniref:MFS transporter n=1 Tax=Paraburkholderia tropica TaxID=92647 RepID=UPI002AB68A6A|nr:MFS transporter [Paraburkholderia tropica]
MANEEQHYEASLGQKLPSIFLPCLGYFAIMGIPMIFGALMSRFAVDAATATVATTSEVAAMTVASLLVSLVLDRLRLKSAMVAAILLIIVGQAVTFSTAQFNVAVVARAATGFGEGLCIGLGLASLAQVKGGAKWLSFLGALAAVFTWIGFLCVPALTDRFGPNAVFFFSFGWAWFGLILAFLAPNRRLERHISNHSSFAGMLDRRNVALFTLCLLSCIGTDACWLYFEQVGEHAGLDAPSVGLIGSTATLLSVLGPFIANFFFKRIKGIGPLVGATVTLGIGSILYIKHGVILFWIVVVVMTVTYVFLMAYARMYSAYIDASGRATAAVGAADSLGLLIGPVIVATFLNLESGYQPLGNLGAVLQLLTLVPAALLVLSTRSKGKSVQAAVGEP